MIGPIVLCAVVIMLGIGLIVFLLNGITINASSNRTPQVVVNIQKYQNVTVYNYTLPGLPLPAALYVQGGRVLGVYTRAGTYALA